MTSAAASRPPSSVAGLRLAIRLAVVITCVAFAVAWALGGRPSGLHWVDLPLLVTLGVAAWLASRPHQGTELAAGWTVGAGVASTLGIASKAGSAQSPVLPVLLVLVVFAFRFLGRRHAMWTLAVSVLGVVALAILDATGLSLETRYVHSAVESGVILGCVMVLSGLLLALDWDDRAATMDELRATTRRLTAVNDVLLVARTDALDRARQQQLLARLTMVAFEGAPTEVRAPEEADAHLRGLLTRCCRALVDELNNVQVTVQQGASDEVFGPPLEVTVPRPGEPVCGCSSAGQAEFGRREAWPVMVDGRPWGLLRVAWCNEGDRTLSVEQRLFVEGVLSLVTAVVGRHATMSVLRRTESQLVEAQRLEGVAFMASGVVHDLNNALTCIIGNTQIALECAEADVTAPEELRDVERAALGAREVCRRLLDSARGREDERAQAALPEVVVDVMRTMRRTIGDDIYLDCDVADFQGRVPVSPGKAEQLILNLLVNARDAMPDGGHLLVTLGPLDPALGARSGWLELSVQDTGMGIPEHVRAHIFEPLFTTKVHNGGTGLGLATVASIVREAGGQVHVESQVGMGTTFRVVLPMLEAEEEGTGPMSEDAVQQPVVADGSPRAPRILLVEDDPRVRSSVLRSLQRYGYDVLEASDADQALDLSRRHGESIDLLLTDFNMPRMDGLELGRQVRLEGLDLPLLLVTGWADSARFRQSVDHDWDRLLEKPFTSRELRDKVDELLAERGVGAPVRRTG